MTTPARQSRRAVVATLAAILGGGCLTGGAPDAPPPTAPSGTSPSVRSRTPTPTTTPNSEEQLERLPEPSPLADPLPDLVRADDRRAFADEHGLAYRDGAVEVEIELRAGGERPEEYLSTVTGAYGRVVVAFVDVDDLVDLATDDDVRIVRPPTEVRTHAGPGTAG